MNARGRAAALLWCLALAVLAGIVVNTRFTTDMSAFLPSAPAPEQQILVDQLREGVASRLLLVAITGADENARAALSRRLAVELRGSADFALVDNGVQAIGGADEAYVWRNRYLLSPALGAGEFSASRLRQALDQDLDQLASGMEPLVKDRIVHDPTDEITAIVRTFAGAAQRELRGGVWSAADGSRALLLAQTRAPGFDIDAQEQALAALRAAFDRARAAQNGAAEARLLITGPGVFAVDTRAQMKHDVSRYSALAMALIAGLLLGLYRSGAVLLLSLAPVLTAALAGLAAVRLWFGSVHGITLGFGVTLIGESVDYAVYLFVQARPEDGVRGSLARIWPTLRLGCLVSICGFSTMLFSSFTGFAQLGAFTIAGLATALAVTRWVLPGLVPAAFAGVAVPRLGSRLAAAARAAGRLRLPLLGLAAAALALLLARGGALWQDELSSMSPVSASDQALDRELRRDTGAPDVRYLALASAADRETALQACERADGILQPLVAQGALAGYDSPARYLPSLRMQQARRATLPAPAELAANLAAAVAGTPFRLESFAPFQADVAAARTSAPLAAHALDGTALGLRLDALLLQRGGRWIALMPLRDPTDPGTIAQALAALPPVDGTRLELLDLKAESDRMLLRYRHEALALAAFGSSAIALLLLLHFRSARQTALVLAPLAVALLLTLALLVLPHGRISIFNLFGLLLVVAVGSNYCLFFRRGELDGRTLSSLVAANLCTVTGFGALSLSRLPVLNEIGGTVAIGTALSLLAAAVLIPAGNRGPEPAP